MADNNSVIGSIGIKNNVSAVLREIKRDQSAFRKETAKAKKELAETWDKKRQAKLDTSLAMKAATALRKKTEPLRKKIVKVVAMKDLVTSKVKSVTTKLHNVGKIVARPLVKLKDMTSKGLSSIGSKLKSVAKKLVIPVTIAATVATAAVGGAVKSGMELEQQQVSMRHFVGATNKDYDQAKIKSVTDDFVAQLRDNANKTPFETGDVMQAGSRAIAVASGNTKDAMGLVTLAEDMAAASGGTKSISDAIEALADAKLGEMERLKEFGFKVSADEFKNKGFGGVTKELTDFYGGAAQSLASSGAGLLSTIKGKIKSNIADIGLGIVEKLKPAMDTVISLIDKASPAMMALGGKLADGIGKGIEFIGAVIPKVTAKLQEFKPFIDGIVSAVKAMAPAMQSYGNTLMQCWSTVGKAIMPVISTIVNVISTTLPAVMPVLQTVITGMSQLIAGAAPIISGLVTGIGTVIQTLAPVFNTIFGGIADKVGSVIDFIGSKMGFITEVINFAAPLISDILSTAWTVISPVLDVVISVFKILFNVVQKVFPGIQKVITVVWNILKPVVEVIGTVIGGIAKAFNWVADKLGGSKASTSSEVGQNATGTNNWRGGLSWVGERGPELIDVPRGARILPNKESVSLAGRAGGGKAVGAISIAIAKLADTIIVREDADIDRIANEMGRKILEAMKGLVPA